MKLLLITVLLIPSVFTQNDWGCNHIGGLPADVCIPTSLGAYLYACNGTDTISLVDFDTYIDCQSGADPAASFSYDFSIFENYAECENSNSCGTFQVICDGAVSVIVIPGVCYSEESISYEYSCSGSINHKNVW